MRQNSATGYFGPLTKAAVAALQTKNGLEPVGTTGPLTRAFLNKVLATPAQPTGQVAGTFKAGEPATVSNFRGSSGGGGTTVSSGGGGGGSSSAAGGGGGGTSTETPADTTAPTITATGPASTLAAGTTQTTLALTTNETASCVYSAAEGTAFDAATAFGATNATTHSAPLTGLANGTAYTYHIQCKDSVGNVGQSSLSFSVATPPAPQAPSDTTAPSATGRG